MNQIKKNQPKIDPEYAKQVATLIEAAAVKYKLRAQRISAIAMQESQYVADAKNCYMVRGRVRCDFCMMQVNDQTIKDFNLDLDLLMTDLAYCIDSGVMVLKDFHRMYGKRELEWWTRYNSSKPTKREAYRLNVERYM